MLLKEIKTIYHKELDGIYGKEEATSFFYLLIEHYLKLERFVLALQPTFIISKEEETPLFEALSRLKLNEPVQHIIGKTDFMDMDFIVNKNVLIPRSETEELVRWIIEEYKIENSKLKILDIGTGSGCIAIALAKYLPEAKVFALDVSEKALEIAKENAKQNQVEITLLKKDIFNLEAILEEEELVFDLIVSNPPYVREMEKLEMQSNVLDNEPNLALFVSDEDPLVFYKKIVQFAIKNLKKDGALYFEINQYLGKETSALLKEHNFSEIELRKDMFSNDRMLRGKL